MVKCISLWRQSVVVMWLALAVPYSAYAADASDYPQQQPIRLIVGYPPGGSADLNGRLLGKAMSERFNQTVIVENVGGAGGTIGAQKVADATPDGYTLLMGTINEMAVAQLVNPSIKYDSLKDFTAIGLIGSQPLMLAASKKSKISSIDDYVGMASSGKSEDFDFGSSGVGTALHLTGEMINSATHGKVQHVPYRGVSPLVTDMVSGQLDFGVFGISSGLPQAQAGTITIIGVTSGARSSIAPDVPALAEHPLFTDLNVSSWYGLFGPAGVPDSVMTQLKAVLADIVHDPAFQDEYKNTGGTVTTESIDMNSFLRSEQARYKQAAENADIGS